MPETLIDFVLLNDIPDKKDLSRGIGVYRLTTELEKHGHSTLVIDYASCMSLDQLEVILSKVKTHLRVR